MRFPPAYVSCRSRLISCHFHQQAPNVLKNFTRTTSGSAAGGLRSEQLDEALLQAYATKHFFYPACSRLQQLTNYRLPESPERPILTQRHAKLPVEIRTTTPERPLYFFDVTPRYLALKLDAIRRAAPAMSHAFFVVLLREPVER